MLLKHVESIEKVFQTLSAAVTDVSTTEERARRQLLCETFPLNDPPTQLLCILTSQRVLCFHSNDYHIVDEFVGRRIKEVEADCRKSQHAHSASRDELPW